MCHDSNITLKLQAKPISILIAQVYMPAPEYEDDKVEELYGVIEEILEQDGKGVTGIRQGCCL
jgi:hypothetical protein